MQSWIKILKKKPVSFLILGFVLLSAIVTIFRLTSVPPTHNETQDSSPIVGRSTSPIELSWPLSFSQSKQPKSASAVLKQAHVNDEQIKKLKTIYPLYDFTYSATDLHELF